MSQGAVHLVQAFRMEAMHNQLLHHYLLKARLQKEGEHHVRHKGNRMKRITLMTLVATTLLGVHAHASEPTIKALLDHFSALLGDGYRALRYR